LGSLIAVAPFAATQLLRHDGADTIKRAAWRTHFGFQNNDRFRIKGAHPMELGRKTI
jgi:hypothetical protein